MKRLLGWYGAGPLHLLSLLACFALAGYAAAQLIPSRPLGVAVWFLGAVIGHDLVLMPLYSLADRSAVAVLRHRAPGLPTVAWINYVRVPAALSGLLLLIWFPLILRLPGVYHASTTLSAGPYLWHWLAVTGALFLLSAIAFAVRLRATTEHADSGVGEDQARPAAGEGAEEAVTAHEAGPAEGDPGEESPRDDTTPAGSPHDVSPHDDRPRDDAGPGHHGPRADHEPPRREGHSDLPPTAGSAEPATE
jgi:hypothetical protein